MDDCQNLDKLDEKTLSMVAWAFKNHVVGWDLCHAVEIRLDNPFKNLMEGGDGVVLHGGCDGRGYIKHYSDDNWAGIHWKDPSWKKLDHDKMIKIAEQVMNETKNTNE